jgi:nucleotide-binding universal stress UspA family protein
MKRFKNLLVVAPDDDTKIDEVLAAAIDLAQRNEAELTVFSVVEKIPARRRFLEQNSKRIDLEELLLQSRMDYLKQVTPPTPFPVTHDVVSGVDYLEIIEKVSSGGYDLVITAPEPEPARRGLRSSSLIMHLMRKCPVPVWVHSPDTATSTSVAVAVGPLDAGEPTDSLNRKLLELGSSMAQLRGGALHIIHAWRLEGETLMRSPRLAGNSSRIELMAEEAFSEANQRLQELIASVDLVDDSAKIHLVKGHAGDVVADAVAEIDPGIVVMGTVARTGIPGMIIGNTAERVLGSLDTSVLAVKPYGFVSPVEALKSWEPQQLPY